MHDDVMAYVWTNVAAANGSKDAPRSIKIFAKKLDKSDLRKAQKLSRSCLKRRVVYGVHYAALICHPVGIPPACLGAGLR